MLFSSHDHEMIQTLGGIMNRKTTLEEYLENKDIQAQLKKMYAVNAQFINRKYRTVLKNTVRYFYLLKG